EQRGRHAQRAEGVHLELTANACEVKLGEAAPQEDPRVVDEDVDRIALQPAGERLHRAVVRYVDTRLDPRPQLDDLLRGLAARGDHAVPALCERAAEGEAYPAVRPRDERRRHGSEPSLRCELPPPDPSLTSGPPPPCSVLRPPE